METEKVFFKALKMIHGFLKKKGVRFAGELTKEERIELYFLNETLIKKEVRL